MMDVLLETAECRLAGCDVTPLNGSSTNYDDITNLIHSGAQNHLMRWHCGYWEFIAKVCYFHRSATSEKTVYGLDEVISWIRSLDYSACSYSLQYEHIPALVEGNLLQLNCMERSGLEALSALVSESLVRMVTADGKVEVSSIAVVTHADVNAHNCIVDGLILDWPLPLEIQLMLKNSKVVFPISVSCFSCDLVEDDVDIILQLCQQYSIRCVASQRTIAATLKNILFCSGILCLERLSLRYIHHFARLTNSKIIASTAVCKSVSFNDFGQLQSISIRALGAKQVTYLCGCRSVMISLVIGTLFHGLKEGIESCIKIVASAVAGCSLIPRNGFFEMFVSRSIHYKWLHCGEVERNKLRRVVSLFRRCLEDYVARAVIRGDHLVSVEEYSIAVDKSVNFFRLVLPADRVVTCQPPTERCSEPQCLEAPPVTSRNFPVWRFGGVVLFSGPQDAVIGGTLQEKIDQLCEAVETVRLVRSIS